MRNHILIRMLFVASIFSAALAQAKMIDEHIYLIPAGETDDKVLEAVKARLPQSLPMSVKIEISRREKIPEAAYDASRRQYNAEAVLNDISTRNTLDTRNESALIIVDVDLYSSELNFVFGLANTPKAACVISFTRLKNEFYGLKPDNKLFLDRVLKEAVHELGHAWGLPHCSDTRCVMYFSNNLSDTDRRKSLFCRECQGKLLRRYGSPLWKGSFF